jgi:hypothetical protein
MAATEARVPLSSQQELWCEGEELGAFNPRFIVSMAVRITGAVDVAALQAALDDVVARHELLRTEIVRDAQPPYQQISAPMPAPLVVRDVPPSPGRSRDEVAEELLGEAERSSVPVEQLPLIRAVLSRFDERDSVLSVVSHHTACDGWSVTLLLRDLTAYYAARTGAQPLTLPEVTQYQDYVRWQLGNDRAAKMAYWHKQLDGAGMFTLPTDRPVRTTHIEPYVRHSFVVDPEVTAAVSRFVKAERCSGFMVMLAAFNVLAHRIRGTFEPVINTMVHGRGQPEFRDTVGPFLNFLAMRTDLSGCVSFRDVVIRTRATCLYAYENEVPIQHVQNAIPSLVEPLAGPRNCDFIFGYWDASVSGTRSAIAPLQISEGSYVIRKRERASEQMPGGAAWNMSLVPSGELSGGLQYSPEEFDEHTVAGWVSDYCEILATAMAEPNLEWKAL